MTLPAPQEECGRDEDGGCQDHDKSQSPIEVSSRHCHFLSVPLAHTAASGGAGNSSDEGGLSPCAWSYTNLLTGVLISARVTRPERHTVSPMNAAQCCSEVMNCRNP